MPPHTITANGCLALQMNSLGSTMMPHTFPSVNNNCGDYTKIGKMPSGIPCRFIPAVYRLLQFEDVELLNLCCGGSASFVFIRAARAVPPTCLKCTSSDAGREAACVRPPSPPQVYTTP